MASIGEYDEFKSFELSGWEQRASTYLSRTERLTASLAPGIVDSLEPLAGLEAVDLASGPGYGAAEMASRGAHSIGTDFASAMVELARERYPELRFQQEDAENLSFEDASFDRVLCCFGMLHFAHPHKALAEVFRVLRPGGRFTFSVWAPPQDFPMFGLLGGVIAELGNLDVGLPEGPPAEAFSIEGVATEALVSTGFEMVSFTEASLDAPLCPASEIPTWYREISVRSQGLLDGQDPEKLPTIEAELIRRFADYQDESGVVVLPMPHRIVTVAKPTTAASSN